MSAQPVETPSISRVDDSTVAVVIVNYNVRHFLEQCLQSVRRAAQGLAVQVFVVDNASTDDSLSTLARFPDVTLLANEENVGFARANNQAIRQSSAPFILLLNPDTLIPEDTLSLCLEYATQHPRVGCIGARMIDGGGEFLPESKRGFPGPWVSFTKMSGLSKLAPASAQLNGYYLGHLDEHDEHTVDVLPGAFMFLRRSALQAVGGGLDEDYFMYGEDVDLSYCIQQAGYVNVYFPEVTILHYKGESTRKRSMQYVRTFYGAMATFSRKHVETSANGIKRLMLRLAIYGRAALALFLNGLASITLPLLDAAALVTVLLAVKQLWASHYFGDPNYYATAFGTANAAIYVSLWLLGLYLAGSYDKPYRIAATLKGMLVGTLAVLVAYALLPEALRTSRAIILLSAAVASLALILIRGCYSLARPRDVQLTAKASGRQRRVAVLGSEYEANRAMSLLGRAGVARKFIGRIAPKSDIGSQEAIGTITELGEVLTAYNTQELIICNRDVSYRQTLSILEAYGQNVEVRTLGDGAQAIVGSPARNTPGAAYAIERDYALHLVSKRRSKRQLDLAISMLLLLVWPLALFADDSLRALRNALRVISGRLTWVGYAANPRLMAGLPTLRPAVLPQGLMNMPLPPSTAQRINKLYARNYSVAEDLRTIWRFRRELGRTCQPNILPASNKLQAPPVLAAPKSSNSEA